MFDLHLFDMHGYDDPTHKYNKFKCEVVYTDEQMQNRAKSAQFKADKEEFEKNLRAEQRQRRLDARICVAQPIWSPPPVPAPPPPAPPSPQLLTMEPPLPTPLPSKISRGTQKYMKRRKQQTYDRRRFEQQQSQWSE